MNSFAHPRRLLPRPVHYWVLPFLYVVAAILLGMLLPAAGSSFTIHSTSTTGTMPIVESTWLCAGAGISIESRFARTAQMPHATIVANVQPSQRAIRGL